MMDLNKLSAEKQLDTVLSYLCSLNGPHKEGDADITKGLNKIGIEVPNTFILIRVLLRLKKDGFVLLDDPYYWYISFDGEMLIKNGGYIKQKRQSQTKNMLQFVQTWVIVLGAIIAAIYSIKQIFFDTETASTIIHYHLF